MAQGPEAGRVEVLEGPDGRRTAGRIEGDGGGGFRFLPEGGGTAVALEPGLRVIAEGPGPAAAVAVPPFQARLGMGQQVSGRLGRVDDRTVHLEDGPIGAPVAIDRAGVRALVQRPGEVQVFVEGFEALDPGRWARIGTPAVVAGPHTEGGHSLEIGPEGDSVTHRLAEPIGSGRLELSFHDEGAVEPSRRWFVDLLFRGAAGEAPIRANLGWDEASLAVLSPRGPALAVQHLARRPGWHRLIVRFGPERTELSVDGAELARGPGPDGPLVEVRIASQVLGRDAPAEGLASRVDDLRLARFTEPIGGLEVDPTQDEARLVEGDQLFGRLRSADAAGLVLEVAGKDVPLGWSEVAGVYFRRAPRPGAPVTGLLVRLEWQAAPGRSPHDLDRLEGALVAVSDEALTLETPYTGRVAVPRDRLRTLEVLGRGRRLVLDPTAHHLGNEVITPDLDPPAAEGGTLELAFELDRVPEGAAALVLDVVQVVGEAGHHEFSELVKAGQLRTSVLLNGMPFDTLNRHIETRNEEPRRVRLPVPAGRLRAGTNVLRIEQAGKEGDPDELDDLGILGIALEFDAPAEPGATPP